MKKRVLLISAIALATFIAALGVIAYLFFSGHLWFIDPSRTEYPVRGIDVSEHQGEIDWQTVSDEGFQFAFIKATEGMDHTDGQFARNWQEAGELGIIRGAYHFFTFRSPGVDQARHFINVVPAEPGCLPPVIDIEFAGNSKEIPSREAFQAELRAFIDNIEAHYLKRPILYVAYDSYKQFIQGKFADCLIWIRDLFHTPHLPDGRPWLFWQYTPRGKVAGIQGFVDLNVFRGGSDALEELVASHIH